jgi:hypothetical protein
MKVLIDSLGLTEAGRFMFLVNKEPFDYTKWHTTLYEEMSVREISAMAQKQREAEQSGDS